MDIKPRRIFRPLPRRYDDNCKDCGLAFYGFMVEDKIWKQAGYGRFDMACLPCLEKRLGRSITMEDFKIVPLNFMNVEGFATEDNYRKLYAKDGADYDKTKAEYFERCARLGLEPKWDTAAIQTTLRIAPMSESSRKSPSGQSEC